MGDKIVVGPVNHGLRNDVTAFVIDNDSFPTLINAYQWRGRLKRKRGTSLLTRLQRFFNSTVAPYFINNTSIHLLDDGLGNGVGNIFSFLALKGDIIAVTQAILGQVTSNNHNLTNGAQVLITNVVGMTQLNGNTYTITVVDPNNFTINANTTGFTAYISGGLWQNIADLGASLVPGSVVIVDLTNGNTYTDNGSGVLVGVPAGTGTVNYTTGDILITGGAGDVINASFRYYPSLPVMGLRDLTINNTQFPGTLAFDTKYSYNIQTVFPYNSYDVSFYKNPITGTYPLYVAKTTETPTIWNGQDYQQFWSTNYQNGFWVTNGITVPFSITNIGMQFAPANTISAVAWGSATTLTMTIANSPLVIGDFVFLNEWTSGTAVNAKGVNFQTGYVIAAAPNTPALANKTITIKFPNANIANDTYTPGIVQYLTNSSDVTKDSLRYYDGDPTNGSAIAPALTGSHGWVNFAPPLSSSNYSVAELPLAQYYLVGARMVVNFKDRLLFLGAVVQTSSPGSQVYLQDTIVYSQNGTPYYTASFHADPGLVTTLFDPILVPTNQTATPTAYWEDQTGFGGFVSAGIEQDIITSGANEDVLIIGFTRLETRLIYTGNDTIPFNFFIINSELGSESTFSSTVLDKGVMSQGSRGFIMTSQTDSSRIDLEIPDEIFEVQRTQNGPERSTAQRDFINEWVYFTYPVNSIPTPYRFPTQSLQFNYRDNSWAVFRETYTTYGLFRKQTGFTWATVGTVYPTWESWNDPWSAGESTLLQPQVIGGNQQGFVIVRADGTGEATSLSIQNIVGNLITSPDHCLNNGDYIVIIGAVGTVSTFVNGVIFQVSMTTQNTFIINATPPASTPPNSATYLGLGVITRMYVPIIQSKQFPTAWAIGRKTRLGFQQYLLSFTPNAQITLQIFLSQDASNPYNQGNIVPQANAFNDGLIYSQILYTCPESTNLGLTPANINLQMVTALTQKQIWHRVNTSLIGDTVQVGFTMSDAQMTDPTFSNQFEEIEIHGFILDVSPSQMLC